MKLLIMKVHLSLCLLAGSSFVFDSAGNEKDIDDNKPSLRGRRNLAVTSAWINLWGNRPVNATYILMNDCNGQQESKWPPIDQFGLLDDTEYTTSHPYAQNMGLEKRARYTLTITGFASGGYNITSGGYTFASNVFLGDYTETFGTCPFGSDGSELQDAVDDYLSGGTVATEEYGDISGWDVKDVTTFASLFSADRNPDAATFNADISAWNTKSAKAMSSMFSGAALFDQDLSGWTTDSVTIFDSMFDAALAFTGQGLENWNVGSGIEFKRMFQDAQNFNGAISGWSTGNAQDMQAMFKRARSFDQDLGGWDTSSVISFNSMFKAANVFQGTGLQHWDVDSAINFKRMFHKAKAFHADISDWKPNAAVTMKEMFNMATAMTTNLCDWNNNINFLSNLNVEDMFTGASGCGDITTYENEAWAETANNYDGSSMSYLCGVCA